MSTGCVRYLELLDTVFLVLKAASVERQGEFIASKSALRVKTLRASLDIDVASE